LISIFSWSANLVHFCTFAFLSVFVGFENHKKLELFGELSIKDVHTQGEGKFVQCGYFSEKGVSSDAESTSFAAKSIGFFEIYGVSVRTRGEGVSQCGHFLDN